MSPQHFQSEKDIIEAVVDFLISPPSWNILSMFELESIITGYMASKKMPNIFSIILFGSGVNGKL